MRDMPSYAVHLGPCACGKGWPMVRNCQVAEDCVETWVECASCGTHTDYIEGAYSDPYQAIDCWNKGERFAKGEAA
jgi:hypothetical protein